MARRQLKYFFAAYPEAGGRLLWKQQTNTFYPQHNWPRKRQMGNIFHRAFYPLEKNLPVRREIIELNLER